MQRLCCHMHTVVLLLWAQDECTCNHVPCYSFLMSCIIAPFTLAVFIHFVEWHRVVSVQTSSSEYNDLLMSFEASLHSEPLIFVTRAADQTLTLDKGIAEKVSLTLPPTTSQSGYPPVVASVFLSWNWRRSRANTMRWDPNVQINTCLLEIYVLCTCPNEFNLKGKLYGKDLKAGQKNSLSLRCLFI